MRTTIDIPDELYHEVELKASREGVPVDDLIAQSLRLALSAPAPVRRRIAFPLHHSASPGVLSPDVVRAAEEITAQREDSEHAGAM